MTEFVDRVYLSQMSVLRNKFRALSYRAGGQVCVRGGEGGDSCGAYTRQACTRSKGAPRPKQSAFCVRTGVCAAL